MEYRALGLTRAVLSFLLVLNWIQGALILGGLVASFTATDFLMRALQVSATEEGIRLLWGMRLIAVVGIATTPLYHVILSRFLEIVGTVRRGDAFAAENADRLKVCAWVLLILQMLRIVVSAIAGAVQTKSMQIDVEMISLTGWLSVLLLFVLAQVFREGSRMREDLEATV